MIIRLQFDAPFGEVREWARENLNMGDYVLIFPFKFIDFWNKEDSIAFSLRFRCKEVTFSNLPKNVQSTN